MKIQSQINVSSYKTIKCFTKITLEVEMKDNTTADSNLRLAYIKASHFYPELIQSYDL